MQRSRIGAQAFIDVGRVQGDFTSDRVLGGTRLGLKHGVGGGTYVIWGEGALVRADVAYSPDAAAYASTVPLGSYIVESHSYRARAIGPWSKARRMHGSPRRTSAGRDS